MAQRNQAGFAVFEFIVVMLLIGIIGLVGYMARQSYLNARPQNSVNQQFTRSTSPCDIRENDRGCVINGFQVLSPNGGEQLCLGSTYTVRWKAPADFETVTLTLRETSLDGEQYRLGGFPASDLKYDWVVTNVPPGGVYKLWVNSVYKSSSVNDSSDKLFRITSC
jgi:hypothetical protein